MSWMEVLGFKKPFEYDPDEEFGPPPPQRTSKPMTQKELLRAREKMAWRPPSFTDLLPYTVFNPEHEYFVLKDGSRLGMMFDLGSIATEAQSEQFLELCALKVQSALDAIPEPIDDPEPWIVQFFLNDDRDITPLKENLRQYIASQHEKYPERQAAIMDSPLTQAVLNEVEEHLKLVSREKGLFEDSQVTGQTWRGQIRRVRCCVYKKFRPVAQQTIDSVEELKAVAVTLIATFTEAGISAKRAKGKDLYEWLLPFFNRNVPWANDDSGHLLRMYPYPGDTCPKFDHKGKRLPPLLGWEIGEWLNKSEPYSNLKDGCWEFDHIPVKAITLQSLNREPDIGHFSAEHKKGKESFARFDRLPPGSMLSITIVVAAQHKMQQHIERIRDASRANNTEAQATHRECVDVLNCMTDGNKLFPMMLTLFVTAPTVKELKTTISQISALLTPTGLGFIKPEDDLVPLDTFLYALPFNFDAEFDRKHLRRTRLTFASQIAALLPLYGRSRGTPHPGMWFWNRGGEPVWVDPLNKYDRKKNAHMLVLGPTGAGKSATLNYIARMTMAVHKPRLVIADAGQSFRLLVEDFKQLGLTTHCVTLTSNAEVALPPFLHAYRLLEDPDVMESFSAAEEQAKSHAGLPDPDIMEPLIGDDEMLGVAQNPKEQSRGSGVATTLLAVEEEEDEFGTDKRDYLGEMLIAAIMMVTGGEPLEVAKMGRADRFLISRAIILATIRCKQEGKAHPLTQDIALELMGMDVESVTRKDRSVEMGQAMMSFTQGLRGRLFNRVGEEWPDADVTLVEMGTLTKDGYEDALAVAYTSLLDSVQDRAERFQDQDRPLIMLTDEGHLITTNELLGPKIAKGTKMWRKLNCWFWLATQNLKDFPDSMSRVLSMCEYWMLLTMDKSEIEDVARFRRLSEEERQLIESARKEPPKYTEGVILSAIGHTLFRNVPPALPIALAMTEGHEKAARRRIMDAKGCTELEAAYLVAQELTAKRG